MENYGRFMDVMSVIAVITTAAILGCKMYSPILNAINTASLVMTATMWTMYIPLKIAGKVD